MKIILLTIALFGCCLISMFSQSSDNSLIYILDGSGSMWAELKGTTKIAMAKAVMKKLSEEHSSEDKVGLVVYGHRRQKDCDDVEYVITPQNHDHARFSKAVEQINPTGRTPLYNSAKIVIDQLISSGESATVIMITDGNETCGGDLCQLVKDALAQGIKFVMHIIGFDMGKEDKSALECASRATGGLYLDAEDADQLASALKKANELEVDEISPSLEVKAIKDGELVDVLLKVYKAGSNDEIASLRTYTGEETNPAIFSIPPGVYDISAQVIARTGIPIQVKKDISVIKDKMTKENFDFGAGKISILVTENGSLSDATVNIYSTEISKRVDGGRSYESSSTNPMIKELSPGIYDVLIKSVKIEGLDNTVRLENVEILAGATKELSQEFESAILNVKTTFQGALCDATVNISSVSPKKGIAGGRTYTSPNNNPKSFLLSPGTYDVQVRGVRVEGDPRESFTVTLKKGETLNKVVEW